MNLSLYQKFYSQCNCCPRNCNINRFKGERGFCNSGIYQHISSICVHRGEEPVISGRKSICNIFFSHCNMQCIYCQNYEISNNKEPYEKITTTEQVVEKVISYLKTGVNKVGFVSPSHMVAQVIDIIECIRKRGFDPVFVWNSNGYDKVEIIKLLEPYINVYLPDFKYADDELAFQYSGVKNYSYVAIQAIKEMYRQKGHNIILDDDNEILSGLIIRHLVLPNHSENSIKVIKLIATEISNKVHISLMSQYYPPIEGLPLKISRILKKTEYDEVVDYLVSFGFENGWIQDYSSHQYYRPSFRKEHPFE